MSFYRDHLKPLLFKLDPEDAHNLVTFLAPFWPRFFKYQGVVDDCKMLGQRLVNPIGLAAGFDKNAKITEHIHKLGFGWSEVGSITYFPHEGNTKPRMFRYPQSEILINRMGLNSDGAVVVNKRLQSKLKQINSQWMPLSINIAKSNKDIDMVSDIMSSINVLKGLLVNKDVLYASINISCPNSSDGILADRAKVDDLFHALNSCGYLEKPVILKLSPDSPEDFNEYIVHESRRSSLFKGFICGNTTSKRDWYFSPPYLEWEQAASTTGGMSGALLKEKNITLTKAVSKIKRSDQIIIGCGGISTISDIEEYKDAGASFFQLYSSLVFKGPKLVPSLVKELKKNG